MNESENYLRKPFMCCPRQRRAGKRENIIMRYLRLSRYILLPLYGNQYLHLKEVSFTLKTMARININITSDIEGKNQYVEESLFCAIKLKMVLQFSL
jgi:hypothetical protein